MLRLVPILSVQEFGSRRWRKDYLHRYGRRRANSAQLFPRDGLGSILIEAGKPPGKLDSLCFWQRDFGIA